MKNTPNNSICSSTTESLFAAIQTNINGLSDEEALLRLKNNGKNCLPKEHEIGVVTLFLRQFNNPLFFILLFAMTLSFVLKHTSDGFIIALVVLVSGTVGFIQEYKANKALSELNSIIVNKARVLRSGILKVIDQEDVVLGDIIDLAHGDIVPADAKLISCSDLKISEAILTGEANPSNKFYGELPESTSLADKDNMVFQGTAIESGTGRAIVTATGKNTEIGKIATLLKDTKESKTPLQKQIAHFGKWLSIFLVAINVIVFIVGILMGRPFFEMFMISVVVVVSAVPEGMIPAMSIVLALGMQRLISKKGLVRKIVSAETLGAVSVICADKTGTLTEGKMVVKNIITDTINFEINKEEITQNKKPDHVVGMALKIGVISNDAVISNMCKDSAANYSSGNPTDVALSVAGSNYGYYRSELEKNEPRIGEFPFSSELKIMATLHKFSLDENIIYFKGAPEKILPLVNKKLENQNEILINDEYKEEIIKKINFLTSQGQRIVAVGYKKTDKDTLSREDLIDLVFVGIIVIKDNVRQEAKEAIRLCKNAGVKIIMITGDHANTAVAIANELGIKVKQSQVMLGNEIDEINDTNFSKKVSQILVYARVEPRHKLKIVSFLQKNGEVVAMTGDGVNDAPALKKADIGVAMANGTDVAKEVADLVLLDNNFFTVVEAIKQGRTTFSNIRKVVVYLFTDCFQEMVIISTSVLAGWPLPILPVQILWIKLIESPLPATSLSFETSKNDVLEEKPRKKDEPLLTKKIKINIAFYAFVMDVIALSIFYFYWNVGNDLTKAQTVMFAALGMSTLFNIYNIRSLGASVFHTNPFKNKFLVIATVVGFILFLVAIYSDYMNKILQTTPLNLFDWSVVFLYAITALFVFETGKKITKYKFN